MYLFQGNTYNLKVEVLTCKDEPLDINEVAEVEFTLGSICKRYPDDGLTYVDNCFVIPLSQEETFSLSGTVKYQIRVKMNDGTVTCTYPENVRIHDSLSEEVL